MAKSGLILGLDLGVTSIGWALVDAAGKRIEAAGVRIFSSPIESAKFEQGKRDASNAAARRRARHQRRQIRRRAARQCDLYILLQNAGLLPFAGTRAEARHSELEDLDKKLRTKWIPLMKEQRPDIHEPHLVLCHFLRSRALKEKLDHHDLGRVFYHLGQRRGFLSTRRQSRAVLLQAENNDAVEKKEDPSQIKQSIETLSAELERRSITLGEYLTSVNPRTDAIRNRKRPDMKPIWTGREMYIAEFERIYETQRQYYPKILTDPLKQRIAKLMYWQRKTITGKPGICELEWNTQEKPQRAPKATLLAQHFRVVQTVNNLRIVERGEERRPTAEKRRELIARLETAITPVKRKKASYDLFGLRFSQVKQILDVSPRAKLNLDDEESDSYFRGNRTNAIMARAFGQGRWANIDEKEKLRIVRRWIKEGSPKKLLGTAEHKWNIAPAQAREFASLEPDDGYAALSHVAMQKLLTLMENEGLTYEEAARRVYGKSLNTVPEAGELRPVREGEESGWIGHIPNPVVKRVLSELRRVVNSIIRKYEVPAKIRVELARSLKSTAEERQEFVDENKKQRRAREDARRILREHNCPTGRDWENRILLFHETMKRGSNKCVYCGEPLTSGRGTYAELLAEDSAIEVDHILPRRCHDYSFANLVLAHTRCNQRKGDNAPFQTFGHTPEWERILERAERLGRERRFQIRTQEDLDAFTHRHLTDTRYVSKLACKYLEQLYGGRDIEVPFDDRSRRCVYVSTGALTDRLRKRWGLEGICNSDLKHLPREKRKQRTDHRHHAVDAIVLALTNEATVKETADEASKHDRNHGWLEPRYFSPPWPARGEVQDRIKIFRDDIKRTVDGIIVSHRPDHKLWGPLHEDNYFSPKVSPQQESVFKRVPLHKISDPQDICDPRIREVFEEQLRKLDGDRKKLQSEFPRIKEGSIPVRSARVRFPAKKAFNCGPGSVFSEENHHVAIFERDDEKKKTMWYTPGVVSRFEAHARWRKHRKTPSVEVIQMSDGHFSRFVFYLMKGDMVEMLDDPSGKHHERGKFTGRSELYVLESLSDRDYVFARHCKSLSVAAAEKIGNTDLERLGHRIRIRSIDELRLRQCRKVEVDPLGSVRYLSPLVQSARAAAGR